MMGLLRVAAVGLAAVLVWTLAAGRVAGEQRLPLASIVPGAVVTLPFGCTSFAMEPFDPLCPGSHIHTGVDLAAPVGTAVHAATGGIARAGFDPGGAGIFVAVAVGAHARLLYCHLSRVLIVPGESVTPGQVIGEVGATGLATGAHLHFEVQMDGRAIDPVNWLAS
jgi:murein DD-endopeptidase MepM/ murein hydrolase activator NlpD